MSTGSDQVVDGTKDESVVPSRSPPPPTVQPAMTTPPPIEPPIPSAPPAEPPTPAVSIPVGKHHFRRKVWEHLEQNNLVLFPRPCYGRIPNFKGCEQTAISVADLDVFKQAHSINVNPDKPQQSVRFAVLNAQKNLYVPVPRLASGLLKHIQLPANAIKDDLLQSVSRKGIEVCGKEVGVDDQLTIDLVVCGSVAVSKDGLRIGKGRGFQDLEFAILAHMKAVNQNTVIVTTVHDSQVFNELPVDLFGPHDVPVDIIVTPTEVIHVKNRRPKPHGIIWNILSQRRLDLMPILKLLRDQDAKAGKDVTLKEVDTDVESPPAGNRRSFRRARYVRYPRRRVNTNGATGGGGGDVSESANEERAAQSDAPPRRRRYIRRRRSDNKKAEGESKANAGTTENHENGNTTTKTTSPYKSEYISEMAARIIKYYTTNDDSASPRRGNPTKPKPRYRKNRPLIDFSLIIRNIERSVRVRDLKAALAERGIKPNTIQWRGVKGYCCLHFSKSNPNTISDTASQSHGVDNVISLLQNLKVCGGDSKKQLVVEIMRPISRIETTDVTSV